MEMNLISRLQALSPAERKELLETLTNADLRNAEAKTALKLMKEVLENHKVLSKELDKNRIYTRQSYSDTLEGQSCSKRVTDVALSSLPLISTL